MMAAEESQITIGINQGIMMALAMEVVTPLIGGKGLGFMVFDGMNRANIGISLEAGLGIVFWSIMQKINDKKE